MEDISFQHSIPIQLRFNDFDRFGHVNNTVYFNYYDIGKTEYLTTIFPHLDFGKVGIVVVHIEADFLSQITGDNQIVVQTTVTEMGNKSFTILQRVVDTQTKEVKCLCKSILVAYDLEKQLSMEIPEEWKEIVSLYEKRDVRKSK